MRQTPGLPSFHDGYLTSIALGDRSAVIGLRRTDDRTFKLELGDVEAFQVEDLREGNIILDLIVRSGSADASDYLDNEDMDEIFERLFSSPHPDAAASYHDQHRAFIARQRAELATGAKSLVSIIPAYGADLVAFCGSVRLVEVITSPST